MKCFFRDKTSGGNLKDGMEFHAAGIIIDDIDLNSIVPKQSGKDVAVLFLDPFAGTVACYWRSLDEIEIYKCDDELKTINYDNIKSALNLIDSDTQQR